MSDLDADLYGDLYGNDEGEFTEQASTEKEPQTTSTSEPSSYSTTTTKPSTTTAVTTVKKEAPSSTPSSPTAPTSNSASTTQPPQAPASAPPAAAPQQIPTYEQQSSDYGVPQHSPHQSYSSFQPGSVPPERSIRPSEMKDEGKMFIGGLNWDTTDESLRNYFTQFGKVDACTIMRDAAGRSRCFAFLTFEEPASVNAVMVREHFLDGKIIDPKRAIPRQEHQRATKLFIGGLAGSVTSESMREFFSQFGKVIDSTVMLDRETGRSKGFGFVSFEDTDVQPFLGFGNLEIDGKLIDVKLAQPRYQRDTFAEDQQDGQSAGGGGGGAGPMGGGGGGFGRGNFAGGQQGGNFGVPGAASSINPVGGGAPGNTPFDPQALAALYTRMFQMASGGAMNPMMGQMNPMMTGGMRPGMGMMNGGMMGVGGGMPGGMPGMGAGTMGGGGGMGRGMGGGGAMGGPMNQNIPRGPRGAPSGPQAMNNPAGVGPQRAGQRGQHNYHPYAR